MANAEHLAKLKEGVEAWNKWRKRNPHIQPALSWTDLYQKNLSKANLSGAGLIGANLSRANLRKANLSEAILRETNLDWANLSQADMNKANLSMTSLFQADLSRANLRGASLVQADVSDANFSRASLSLASLYQSNLSGADLSGADLTGADLREATLLQTNLEGANLTGCSVYGIAAWDLRLEGAIQSNLVITNWGEPPIQVDNLEVAQFVYLLLSRQKLRNVITTIGEKAVLILGRFTERKELLDRMADKLRSLGYIPMIFEFERPTDRDLTETIKILAGLSRFVIADITNPRSVPLELQAVVPDYMVPFVTILQRGQPAFGMFDDLPRKYHWALPLLEYNTADTLLDAFEKKVVVPALRKAAKVRREKAAPPLRRSAED